MEHTTTRRPRRRPDHDTGTDRRQVGSRPDGETTPRPRPRSGPPLPAGTTPWSVVTTIALAALLGMVIWNINLRGDVQDLEQDLAAAETDARALRAQANATVYHLAPSQDGPENAHAQAWFSLQGSGVLSVANMPALPQGRTYQLWYVTDNPNAPIPGGTFAVDENGQAFMLIPADVSGVTSLAISEEPEGGSQQPGGRILLQTDLDGARG